MALSENGGISVTNLGITNVPGNPPIITAENYGCINSVVTFTGSVLGNWNFGVDATPNQGFGMGPIEVIYTSLGRKTITFNGSTFTEYVDIFNAGPNLPSISPAMDTITFGCPIVFSSNLTASNYEWIFGSIANPDTLSGPGFQTTDSIYFNSLGQHTFELWTTDSCCGKVRDTGVIYIDTSSLNISLTALYDTICFGDTQVFTADAGFNNYEFFVNGILTQSSSQNTFTTTSLQTGDIVKVIGFLGSCYSNPSSALTPIVIPVPPVNISISDPDTTICQGDSVIFTASPTFYSNYEFFVGTNSVQSGSSNIFITNNLNDLDSITCVSYLGCPGPPSNTIYFHVDSLPYITISSSDTTFCTGDTISVTASPSVYADYEFIVNGISSGSGSNNTVSTNLFSDGDSIIVIATSNSGCIGLPSNELVFIVNPIPAVMVSGSLDTACLGDIITFTASPTGYDNYEFFDGLTSVQSGPNNTFIISTLSGGTHNITVISTDLDCPSPISNTVIAEVLSGPSLVLSSNLDTICDGDSVAYTASPTGFVNYEFFVSGISVQSGTSPIYSTSGLIAGDSVYVIGTDLGCPGPASNIKQPIVNPLPITSITSADTIICEGDTVIIMASQKGLANYSYFLNGLLVQSLPDSTFTSSSFADGDSISLIGISAAGCPGPISNILTFTVNPIPSVSLISDNDTICYGATNIFSGLPAGYDNYDFYDNGVLMQSGPLNTYIPTPDSNNLITVIATDLNCPSPLSEDTFVTVIYGPDVNLLSSDADSTICDGDSITFTASPTGYNNYEFFINLSSVQSGTSNTFATNLISNGDSIYVIASLMGCPGTVSNVVPFVVNPIPQASITNLNGTICFGDSNTFHANPGGFDNYNFLVNGIVQQIGADTIFTFAPMNDGDSISVVATDLGCVGILSNISIASVNPLPTTSFDYDTVCVGEYMTFTDLSFPNIVSRIWIFGDGDTSYGNFDMHTYQVTGTYNATLIVTDNNGCSNSATNVVLINPLPIVDFIGNPQNTTILNPLIEFTDQSDAPSPYSIISWNWDFNDLDSSQETNPTHKYADTGTYLVSLEIINEFGCIENATLTIVIEPEIMIHIPNSFTPNNDGINDFFIPKGIGIDYDFEMYIFNRWGDLIFETYSIDQPWLGIANKGQEEAQQDIYLWVVYIRDHIGRKHEYVGHVSLIR
ncbi:MAG TPA: PKD domain-containing protein [Flavobacteriales bacterium]|nr:PKD domain-containing protein [Flavobacteriales bacterium]